MVSVIIASYNKEKYIAETLSSVIAQTSTDWELVVVDDCSTDDTVALVKAAQQNDPRIRLYAQQENKGANCCRNKGIELASGNYIVFLDADDLLTPTCLEQRLKKIEETQAAFCVFSMGTFYHAVGDHKFAWKPVSKNPLADFFRHELPWSILQPIWRKDFLQSIAGFDESLNACRM